MINMGGNANHPGLDAWVRQWREMFSGAGSAFGTTGMPDWNAWGKPSAWFGSGAAAPAATAFHPGLGAGPFASLFEQLSSLAQGQWQQLAAGMDGDGAGFATVLPEWRQSLESLWSGLGAPAPGPGPGPAVAMLRETLSTPQVGPLREHVERWQQAMLAQLDLQEAGRAFSALLGEIMQRALALFRERMAARNSAGQAPDSMRAVFDEWIEAGEEAWAERASSDEFVAALGAYSNAQMRVRAARADAINRMAQSLGLPTREEVDADHRRIAQLEREMRRLRRELEGVQSIATTELTTPAAPESAPHPAPGRKTASRAAAKPAAGKTATKKAASPVKAAAARKAAVKKATSKATSKAATTRRGKASAFPLVAAPQAIGKTTRSAKSGTRSKKANK